MEAALSSPPDEALHVKLIVDRIGAPLARVKL